MQRKMQWVCQISFYGALSYWTKDLLRQNGDDQWETVNRFLCQWYFTLRENGKERHWIPTVWDAKPNNVTQGLKQKTWVCSGKGLVWNNANRKRTKAPISEVCHKFSEWGILECEMKSLVAASPIPPIELILFHHRVRHHASHPSSLTSELSII